MFDEGWEEFRAEVHAFMKDKVFPESIISSTITISFPSIGWDRSFIIFTLPVLTEPEP